MLYAIISQDIENSSAIRAKARDAHRQRLHALTNAGRLVLAGPFPGIDSPEPGIAGFTGSLIIAEFDSLESARTWADEDPFVAAGVYKNVDVRPFKQVLP